MCWKRRRVYYEKMLRMPEGAAALAYLRERGVSETAIDQFRLGYAPDGRYAAKGWLAREGFADEAMIEAGLLVQPEDGSRGSLRPFSRPIDVSDNGPAGPCCRLRRAHPRTGRAEIPEFAGDACFSQRSAPLQPGGWRQGGARQGHARRRRRLHGRDRTVRGGMGQRRRAARHRAYRGPACWRFGR